MKMTEHHTQLIIFQKLEIKDYNVMIDGRNLFDQLINSMLKHTKILEKLLQVKG